MKKLFEKIISYYIPIFHLKTFSEIFEYSTYWRNGSTLQHSKTFMFFFYFYLSSWICYGFILNFHQNEFLATIYGYNWNQPINFKIAFSTTAFAASELIIIRLFLLYIYVKKFKQMQIFISLESIIKTDMKKRLLFQSKSIIFVVSFATPFFVPFYFFLYSQNASRLKSLAHYFWSFMTFFLIRFHVCDLVVLYHYIYGVSASIYTKILTLYDKLSNSRPTSTSLRQLLTYSSRDELFVEITKDYEQIAVYIKQTSVVTSFLLFSANIFAIPLFSITVLLMIQKTDNSFEKLINLSQALLLLVYSTHGYLLTAYLSKTHSLSKLLYFKIYTILVRNKLTYRSKKMLFLLLQDLSNSKCRLAYNDSNDGYISQLDILSDVTKTVEIFFLSYSLFRL